MPSLLIVPVVLFVKYGTTRLSVDLLDGSVSYPEPAPDHGMQHRLVYNLPVLCVALQNMKYASPVHSKELCFHDFSSGASSR